MPPKVTVDDGVSVSELAELCYQYRYDYRNRLIEKKVPGKGWEYIVYNKLDQPVLTQDANQRKVNSGKAKDEWLFTKYDAFGRVVYTGMVQSDSNRLVLQESANNTTVYTQHETKQSTATSIAGTTIYYSNNAIPQGISEIYTINYYDDYKFLGTTPVQQLANPGTVYSEPVSSKTKSLPTGSKVKVLGTNQWITTVTYFDKKARPICIATTNEYLGTSDVVETELDFAGKVLETTTRHRKGSNAEIKTVDTFEYDHMGRMIKQTQKINNQAEELIAANIYDELGQLTSKNVGGTLSGAEGLQTVDYNYNVRGWLKGINEGSTAGGKLFGFAIDYNSGTNPLYNGNISKTSWQTANDNVTRSYNYTYDALNRITSGISNDNKYNLSSVSYDKMGNIENLTRNGWQNTSSYTGMDILSYEYDSGNKLRKVTDGGNDTYGFKDGTNTNDDFGYDANGNMKIDRNKGITGITYNHLNLPETVSISNSEGTGTIAYIYDATGAKLKKIVTEGSSLTTTEYTGKYVYKNGQLQYLSTSEGYATPEGNSYRYVYNYKDHLGNTRLSYTKNESTGSLEIIEESNYYPFGLKHKGYNEAVSSLGNSTAQSFKFNEIEFEESLGLNLYEMDLRKYDPAIARWTGIDPVTHHSMSTYTAFDNNPIFWADPSGANSTAQWMEENGITDDDLINVYSASDDENEEESDNQSTQPKYQFFGVSPTGEKMNLNYNSNKDFKILTGYGDDPDDLRKAKLSAYLGLFKTLSRKNQVNVLRLLKIPSKYWVGILGKVGKAGPGSIMPAHNVYDEGFAALPFGVGSLFQPLNDDFNSGARQIENELMWDDILTGFNGMMETESLNDVIIIYSNENLFRQSTINTSEAENLSSRNATGNYKYAYYGTQYGGNLHIFGMYLINND